MEHRKGSSTRRRDIALFEGDVDRLFDAIPYDLNGDRSFRFTRKRFYQGPDTVDLVISDRNDHVSGFEPRFCRGAVVFNRNHERALRVRHLHPSKAGQPRRWLFCTRRLAEEPRLHVKEVCKEWR